MNLPFSARIDKHENLRVRVCGGPGHAEPTQWLGGKIDEVALTRSDHRGRWKIRPTSLRGAGPVTRLRLREEARRSSVLVDSGAIGRVLAERFYLVAPDLSNC